MEMSWTVGILIVSWLCVFSVSEANVASCNLAVECTNTLAFCIEGICECRLGYIPVSGECKSSSITVGLLTQSTNVVYGSGAILTATITSEVPVNPIKWLKGPTELAIAPPKYTQNGVGPGPVTLTIKYVNFDDTGVYQVEASNSAGIINTSNQVSLTVTGEKPTVTVPGTITETGNTVNIHCTASVSQGSPALTTIYWLLNGRNRDISDSSKYSGGIVSNPSLFIHNIGPTDAGEYRCGATNLVGSTTSSQSVTLAPPSVVTISQQPVGAVYHGTSITVTGLYTSFLSVTNIKWQKLIGNNFVDIDITADKYSGSSVTGPSPKLVINPVQLIDETSYRLVVSNGVGLSSSNLITLNAIGGNLTVNTGSSVTGRFGGSVTIACTVTGPEVNGIQWIKYINNIPVNILIDGLKFFGGSLSTKALTINSLTNDDARQYQCTASNLGGTYLSANRASVQVNYGQFNGTCTNSEPCDSSRYLTCSNNKCLCISTYYHKDQLCYPKTGLVPTTIFLNSTTFRFSVFWNNPTNHYELVSGYEVTWRVAGSSKSSSDLLSSTVNQYTVSSGLMSGQLYVVNVLSRVTLTGPAYSIVVSSGDTTVRTAPSAPGPLIQSESNFAHNNLQIKWTAPVKTLVTKYEVTIDGTTYTTMSSNAMFQFTGKVFVPGMWYVISIVTVSGTTYVKRGLEHSEWIRPTPTKPNPPTNVICPQNPLDVSIEISWTAPTEPNGLVLNYQIDVSPGNLGQIYTSSNETHKNVEGLYPEQMYTFTVHTINDALDNTSESSQSRTCTTKAGVATPPTNLEINEVQSKGFRIGFNKPDYVSGILAAYKIVISKGGNCVQQILVHGNCFICKSTAGCPPPVNYTVFNITNDVSYTASGLDPYTHYMVKVVALNGNGEGHPVNSLVTTDEEVPIHPGQITASIIQSSSLILSWTLPDPSPGNTTYTIYTYEGTDNIGTHFLLKEPTKVYGFDTKTLSVTGLEEYWQYKFKVNAATVKGNTTSDFSSVFRTKQAAPGQVLNLTIQKKGNYYKAAYVSWSRPALRDYNGVLKSYLFSNNHTGTMKEEEISVLLSQSTVEKNISVIPETVYVIEVVLQNNESMRSQRSMQIYRAPAGPPPVTDIEPITTNLREHISTENTITIEINTEYFKNDNNGKQVFFGIAVCAKSKCEDVGQNTFRNVWKDLPNWHKAGTNGFPLYRVTNDTFMADVMQGDSRQRRSTLNLSTLKFIIGEDQTCPSLNADVYCNGPLTPGTSYIVVIYACTNGGCSYNQTADPFVTKQQPIVVTNYSPLIGSVIAVTLVIAVVVIGILLWKRNRRHKERKEHKDQSNTYADLNLDERTKADQPYSFLEHGSRTVKSKSVPLNSFFDYVVNLLRNNRQKLTKEYHDLLQYTERAASTVASSKNNVSKNRGNIIPYDFNRVKLCSPGASDYIDASVLLDKCYILTSYPIAKTFGNFWQMVWEQSVSTIVVITGHSDARESWYFSDNEGTVRTIERIDVELLAKFKTSECVTMRKIKMSRGKHSKVVNHFHVISLEMTDLPDQIFALINSITQNNVKNTGPQVVHGGCTGIDNSGVYIAVDHVVKSIVSGGKGIDVYGTARTVMKERMFSISSLEQYSAIYTCLQKYVQNSPACKNDGMGTYEYLP